MEELYLNGYRCAIWPCCSAAQYRKLPSPKQQLPHRAGQVPPKRLVTLPKSEVTFRPPSNSPAAHQKIDFPPSRSDRHRHFVHGHLWARLQRRSRAEPVGAVHRADRPGYFRHGAALRHHETAPDHSPNGLFKWRDMRHTNVTIHMRRKHASRIMHRAPATARAPKPRPLAQCPCATRFLHSPSP